jgi:hypothetical protein
MAFEAAILGAFVRFASMLFSCFFDLCFKRFLTIKWSLM